MATGTNRSVLGRLLEEISWEGRRVRLYRHGGRGMENVLTAEVLLPLSYLPRSRFLGEVLQAATGATETRARMISEAAFAEVVVLPEESRLGLDGPVVQPDATIVTPGCRALVEAKRIRRSAFQSEQLSREYLAILQDAGSAKPLLLLILGAPPPVKVKGQPALVSLDDAVVQHLARLGEAAGLEAAALEEAVRRVPEVIAWTTWDDVRQVVLRQRDRFTNGDDEVVTTVHRLCDSVVSAIDWHS